MTATPLLRMLTFGPMIDSELSRLLLWRYGLDFVEERHLFGWASVLALARGGTGQIPLMLSGSLRLTGPRALVDREEPRCAPERILIPPGQPLRSRVEADWALFNGELAVHTARIAYFHLLPLPDIMLEPFTRGIPAREARLTPWLYPALRWLFTLLLRLQPAVIADALANTERIVGAVDQRLTDGRVFLWGDTPTLSDLALASALAPLLLPPGCSAPLPPYAALPIALRRLVDSLQQHRTAGLVGRVYALRTANSKL